MFEIQCTSSFYIGTHKQNGEWIFIGILARNEGLLKVISAYMASYSCQIYNFISFVFQIFEMVDAKARQDCLKEIELLQSLDHPNIIKYLASFVENNEVCYLNSLFTFKLLMSPFFFSPFLLSSVFSLSLVIYSS